ncbi:hypothetical protein D187_006494 [Cystobacter fuscus DSM 2262]|uniref:Uncharacterized protein n=1 Tax=Cystobacter fuscus (strain ATCC 25194 / DSM 2262 / NBRC 100088 / M29) TaxID=1242864 RepID=S9QP60_CYSF2|nr:hypothetical protein [Cystobacter fuscus]EPX63084.1 hypothetical protein D187_006494 [Cystobacter fuscus DSM 2262]
MQITTWFIAKEEEADAIASIVTTEEHAPEEWTFIEFPLIEMELMALSAALRGTESVSGQSTMEEPLVFDEGGLIVARVVDSFIQALARITTGSEPALADVWAEKMDRDHQEPEKLHALLAKLAGFARQAIERRSPVLSLVTF